MITYLKFLAITGFSAVVIQDLVIYIVTDHLLPSGNKMVSVSGHSLSLATIDLLVAKIMGVGVGLVWNFLLYKYVVFGGKKSVDKVDEIVVA